MKVGEGWVCWVQLAKCGNIAVWQLWPEFDMFGSMPWCSFPWHKLLPRLTQNNFYAVYSQNLIHEFDEGEFCTCAWKAFPSKQGFVDIRWHQCFCVCASSGQDSPKASPMAIFKLKNSIGQPNPLLEWVLNEMWRRLSLLSSKCQQVATLNLSAVQRPANSKPVPDCMFRKLPLSLYLFFPNTFQELKPFPCHVPLVWYMGTSTPKYYR